MLRPLSALPLLAGSWRWPRRRRCRRGPRRPRPPSFISGWSGRRRSRSPQRSAVTSRARWCHVGSTCRSAGDPVALLTNPELFAAVVRRGRRSTLPPPRATASMPACARNRSNCCAARWRRPAGRCSPRAVRRPNHRPRGAVRCVVAGARRGSRRGRARRRRGAGSRRPVSPRCSLGRPWRRWYAGGRTTSRRRSRTRRAAL